MKNSLPLGLRALRNRLYAIGTVAAALSAFGTVSSFAAANETWTTGAGTANWSASGNWVGTNPVPASGDSLFFGSTSGPTTLNNDLTNSAFVVNNLSFITGGTSIYTINGNDFTLSGNLLNTSGLTQTVNDNIILAAGSHSVSSGTYVLGGNLSGAGSLSVTSGINLSLTGANNSYTGGTTLGAATVKVGNSSVFGTGTIALGGATLDNISGADMTIGNAISTTGAPTITYTGATNNLTLSGNVATGSNVTFNISANTLTLSGTISESGGAHNLTKGSAGTLALTGLNTYSGVTTISSGTLSIGNIANIGSASALGKGDATSVASNQASLVINNGATLQYTGGAATTDRLFTLGAGTETFDASGSGALVLSNTNSILPSTAASNRTLILAGSNTDNNTLAASWGNSGVTANALTKNGVGKWVLSGANTYTGNTAINAGILQFAKVTSLYGGTAASWTNAHITVASGATIALNVGGSGEFASSDIDTIKGLGTAANGLRSGSFLGLDTTNAAGGTFTYASNIANSNGGTNVIGVTKLGANTLNLTGSNGYTGVTTVTAGTLLINGTNSGGGAMNVNAGVLGGAGTIAGAVTVGDGAGSHDSSITAGTTPGTTIGILSTGALTLKSDATFAFVLNSTTGLADQLNVTGSVNLLSGATFSFSDLGTGTLSLGTVYTLINNDGSDVISGVFANLANGAIFTNNGNTYQASYTGGTNGNDLVLTVVVPEPSTTLLVGVGLVGLLHMMRRRQAN